MQPITIAVNVPLAAALERGLSQHGEAAVPLTDAHVAQLTPEARAAIMPASTSSGAAQVRSYNSDGSGGFAAPLRVDDARPEAVVEALNRHAAACAVALRDRAAREEAQIQAALAVPAEGWISNRSYGGRCYLVDDDGRWSASGVATYEPAISDYPNTAYLTDAQRRDPRIVERRAEVERTALPAARAEWERRYSEWSVWREARGAEEVAIREHYRAAARAYVLDCVPEFARAAQDGRDVTTVAERDVSEQLRERLGVAGLPVVDDFGKSRDQVLPSTYAYERLDAVRAVLEGVLPHPLLSTIETEIVRADLSSVDGEHDWRTCVYVRGTFANGSEMEPIAVLAEVNEPEAD